MCSAAKALTPDATAEAVTEAAQASGDCLTAFYRGMVTASMRPDAQELFESLIRLKEEERHRATHNLQLLFDW